MNYIRLIACGVVLTTGYGQAIASDAHPAINTPDQFAWSLFVEISKPADRAKPNGPVVWESWALASDVFRNPNRPPVWPGDGVSPRKSGNLEFRPLQQVMLDAERRGASVPRRTRNLRVDPAVLQRNGNETRMNRSTFDFIVSENLYYIEGQEQFFNENRKVDFPVDSKEIKAQWRRLDDPAQYSRYHTAQVDNNGRLETWGLTALHITTKDLPNWFWATFEHTDNLGREAVVPSRDSFGLAAGGGPSSALIDLFTQSGLGDKWQNYVLRGTQVDFVDSFGRPTILANSQIEQGFQATSSCITCHARASIGPKPRQSFNVDEPQSPNDASRLRVFESSDPVRGSIGSPDPSWFLDTSTVPRARKFTQLDFVWSLFRARRRNPFPQPVIPPALRGLGAAPAAGQQENERCCGQAPAAVIAAGDGPTGMNRLERQATRRAVLGGKAVTPEEYHNLVRAATRYAASLAGDDDTKFADLASGALSQAVLNLKGMKAPAAMGQLRRMDAANATAAESSDGKLIWDMPELNSNFRDLMEKASADESGLFPITGPPLVARVVGPGTQEVGNQRLRDCVAVGVRIGGQDRYCCTGTLVAPRVVVSAGHCFFCVGGGANNAVVFIGGDIDSPGQTVRGKAFRHPEYRTGGKNNDLAVIVLDTAIHGVTPRRIATTDEINNATFGRVVGFGNSDFGSTGGFGTKRMVDVPIASHSCSGAGHAGTLGCDPQLEMVAGFVGLGPDSCNGDSGGPIYVLVGDDARDDDAWAVAGATSRATDLATRPCGDGGVYARLDQYRGFIDGFPQPVQPAPQPVSGGSGKAARLEIIEGYPDRLLAKMKLRNNRVFNLGVAPRSVFEKMVLWPQRREITVAFSGGTDDARSEIEGLANQWAAHGNFRFSFKNRAGAWRTWSALDQQYAADIRIGFVDDDGYWSLLGTDSSNPTIVSASQQSMNLEGMADGNLSANERGTVIHEFGHALGFHHEHQTPVGGCDDEFRWHDDPGYMPQKDILGQFIGNANGKRPGIYRVLGGPPNKWSPAVVDFNLRQLPDSDAYVSTAHDPDSIMHYSFPDWMFVRSDSPCQISRNNDLSPADIAGVGTAYPRDEKGTAAISAQRRELLEKFERIRELFWAPSDN